MSDEVKTTERGEVILRTVDGDVRVFPHDGGYRIAAADRRPMRLTRDGLLAFCRSVITKFDPDPVPTVDEAAIRADEAARIAAWLESVTNCGPASLLLHALRDIRAGKHRSTP